MRYLFGSPPALVLLAIHVGGCLVEEVLPEETSIFGNVDISVVADENDGLLGPRDLDFNPAVQGELWVINRGDDAALTISNVGTTAQTILRRKDPFALHFMEETAALSFSAGMKFGTCGESRNTYDEQEQANDFMGPALWSADAAIFAISNPEAVDEVGFDLGSHLDMMHETPLCMGIAWVSDNIYFVFEGSTGTIARYDDMMKIRGQNLWPDAVDKLVFANAAVEEYAGLVFIDPQGRETARLSLEFRPSSGLDAEQRKRHLSALADEIQGKLNVRLDIREADYLSLPRFEFKTRRWTDERRAGRSFVKYTA